MCRFAPQHNSRFATLAFGRCSRPAAAYPGAFAPVFCACEAAHQREALGCLPRYEAASDRSEAPTVKVERAKGHIRSSYVNNRKWQKDCERGNQDVGYCDEAISVVYIAEEQ